ncbi:hypothetical protein D1007_31843 [Hordeum vulgare]|nr:hypothetical protein D1007_31843 [Hordeum vulgare]
MEDSFTIVEMIMEQHAIMESIQDEAEVEANRRVIRQMHAEEDALFDVPDAEMAADETELEEEKEQTEDEEDDEEEQTEDEEDEEEE